MNLLNHQSWGRNGLPRVRGTVATGESMTCGRSQGPWVREARNSILLEKQQMKWTSQEVQW